mmetsp:Transcript_7241/g.26635  ORF Transcript_7241/g.26635 Transcript_7241/m.26635 type:complete len:281 (+) Transcript_7241:130-972(+)
MLSQLQQTLRHWKWLPDPEDTFVWTEDAVPFLDRYWYVLASAAILYVPTIHALQMVMANKKALEIRPLLFVWNLLLCGFSLLSVINIGPTAMKTLLESPDTAICTDRVGWDPALARWRLYFVLSKVPEMMDSVWLVLKKRPVSFLQEYHHLTVMLYCWHVSYGRNYGVAPDFEGGEGSYFGLMNGCVHFVMYGYYAITSCTSKNSIFRSKAIAITITRLQILQMVLGISIQTFKTFRCNNSYRTNYYAGTAMYASYLVLFVKYYIDRYMAASRKREKKSQ